MKNYSVTDGQSLCTEVRLADEPLCVPRLTISSQAEKINPDKKYENVKSKKQRADAQAFANKNKNHFKKENNKMEKKIFGYELVLDLKGCDPGAISSRKKLQEYVDRLCKLIKMEKYGKALLPYFGEKAAHTKGYSLVQLIETSSITGHFSEFWGTAYINIFSCKAYDHKLAKKFTKEFFGAKSAKNRFIVR